MRLRVFLLAAFAMLMSGLLFAAPASAQATRTWVSGVGDDVNPCSRTAPCKTFAGAISKTAAGGEINCLDSGGFGAVTINKSLTIDCSQVEGGALAGGNGITINAQPTDVVVIRGLDIFGVNPPSNGVRFIAGASLHVINCQIARFNAAGVNGFGIIFAPAAANSELFVVDTNIHQNGVGADGGGIMIRPTGSGSAHVTVDNVHVSNNTFGIRADGTGNAGVTVSITNSTFSGNTFAGITSFSPVGGPGVQVMVNTSNVSENGTGLNANGANAVLRVGYSVVSHNATGVTIQNGATATSCGNNQIDDNTAPGNALPITALR